MLYAPQSIAQSRPAPRAPLSFNRYYNYEEMTGALRTLVAAHPELLTMKSIGKSFQGRDLWLLTLNNPRTGPDREKTAMYIDGNIHGNEVQAAEVVLYTAWYLAENYAKLPKITELVDTRAFYLLPMVNPDGRAYWFDQANTAHSSRSGQKPVDDDGDGLFDEDPPDDLDGDGNIVQMRRLDPNGPMKISPDDPRLLIPVEPNDKYTGPRYTLLGMEGIDNDGDGRINEDGPGGYDLNRNWPAAWQPDNVQFGAGDYPLSHPEARAIAEFILDHPNIAAVQAYHNAGGMILRGPGAQYLGEYPRGDASVYETLGRRGEKMLPFYRYMITWRDLYTVHGGFINWTFEELGIFSFTNELWSDLQMYHRRESPSMKERLEFNDYLLFGQGFVEWKPFKHPVYGDIEIGGTSRFGSRVNPGFMLEETCHRNAAFTLYHADQMPLLEISDVEIKRLDGPGDPVLQITVEVKNTRLIPTIAAIAARKNVGRRDRIELAAAEGGRLEVLAGGTIDNRFTAPLRFVERRPERLWVDDGLRGESVRLFRWLVRGQGKASVTYHAQKGGRATRTFDLSPTAESRPSP
ncbi:MAG: peptidase M14 [Phycisphaerae bacterium]|nr:M14 family metallopeptidase [Phycisphaerae bacterium]NUQ48183.1 peptidase M14 [Phycisphaerae bacterium]